MANKQRSATGNELAEGEQFEQLLATVERLRRAKFPSIGAEVVRELLVLHADVAASDADLVRDAEAAVEKRLAEG